MATPIGETPILQGKAATDFLNHILDPPSKKQKELSKKMEEQRFVPFQFCIIFNMKSLNGVDIMATSIGDTPELIGKYGEYFLNNLNKPLTQKEKELQKIRRKQRFVPF